MSRRTTKSNEDALAAFIAKTAEIGGILQRLQALSDDHFGVVPDEPSWGDAGNRGFTPSS